VTPRVNSARDIYKVKRGAGLRKALGGLDYTRCVEYPTILDGLDLRAGTRLLEVGASKLFLAPYIAVRHDIEVHATDQDPVVEYQRKWITSLGYGEWLDSGRFAVAREDATALSYPDESFDRVVCISTIEHIKAVDKAAREISRVLRPGGLAGLTVPFSTTPKEVYVEHDVYGRRFTGAPLFYEYVFDRASLERAVIQPSGLELRSLTFLGEPTFKISRLVYTPFIGHALSLCRWMWPWIAHRFLKPIKEQAVTGGDENIAVLILAKPTEPTARTTTSTQRE
jgi:SAM-dependent methyltransferase